MNTQKHYSFIGYSLLFYCSMLMILVLYLSHFTFDSTQINLNTQTIQSTTNSSPPNNTFKKQRDTDKHRFQQNTRFTSHTHKQSKPHKSFLYDTREPETYQSRPIPDFKSFKSIPKKKKAFIDFFKVIINEQNALQLKRREQLNAIKELLGNGQEMDTRAVNIFESLKKTYRVPQDYSIQQTMETLDRRVNVIPGSIVLAQAASESAWGTSRFARQANNFFGQWCFNPGCGIVPAKRHADANHEIAKFLSAESSVRAYFKNLNTYKTYKEFRTLRQSMIKAKKPLKGLTLVKGLNNYSERGEEYVKDLESIILFNQFPRVFE